MTLIVEDGSVVAGAESYLSAATADTYHANQGNTAWADIPTTVLKEEALRRAAFYMMRFRQRWAGTRLTTTQRLDWPRQLVPMRDAPFGSNYYYLPTTIPVEVVNAQAEYALRAAVVDLDPDLVRAVLSEGIGPIKTDYDPDSPEQPRYPKIEAMLDPFFAAGGGNTIRLIRG